MKLKYFILLIFCAPCLYAGELSFTIEEYTLENGLKVILIPDHSCPSVTLQVWYKTGSRNERPGITGISHLFEHLMFKGTEKYPAGAFDRLVESWGGRDNAWTWLDNTAYYEIVPAEKLESVLELEADRARNLTLNEENLTSERNVVINERLLTVDDSPEYSAYEVLTNNAFVLHPYRWEVIGFMQDIRAISLEDCLEYYRVNYAPNNAFLIIAGDFDISSVRKLVDKHFGRLKAEPPPPAVKAVEPEQRGEKRIDFHRAAQLEALMIGYKTPEGSHPDIVPLQVAAKILFDGESSRLYRRLVYDEEKAFSIYGELSVHHDPNLFYIYAQANPGADIEDIESTIYEEIEKIKTEPPDEYEIQKAKNQLESDFIMGLRSNADRADAVGMFEVNTDDYRNIFNYPDKIQAIAPEDVMMVSAKYLTQRRRTVVNIIPDNGQAEAD
ncbi:MAG: insulinase family protein [Candidatus Zixiibacteriota bacterium]|nr:MAG: insulinase family protein [candidate division Zixibacteria bacterium]